MTFEQKQHKTKLYKFNRCLYIEKHRRREHFTSHKYHTEMYSLNYSTNHAHTLSNKSTEFMRLYSFRALQISLFISKRKSVRASIVLCFSVTFFSTTRVNETENKQENTLPFYRVNCFACFFLLEPNKNWSKCDENVVSMTLPFTVTINIIHIYKLNTFTRLLWIHL